MEWKEEKERRTEKEEEGERLTEATKLTSRNKHDGDDNNNKQQIDMWGWASLKGNYASKVQPRGAGNCDVILSLTEIYTSAANIAVVTKCCKFPTWRRYGNGSRVSFFFLFLTAFVIFWKMAVARGRSGERIFNIGNSTVWKETCDKKSFPPVSLPRVRPPPPQKKKK